MRVEGERGRERKLGFLRQFWPFWGVRPGKRETMPEEVIDLVISIFEIVFFLLFLGKSIRKRCRFEY